MRKKYAKADWCIIGIFECLRAEWGLFAIHSVVIRIFRQVSVRFVSTDESNGQYLDYFDDGICWCVREVLLDCEK